MLIGKVFRIKYKTVDNRPWTKRVKVFTQALKFAKKKCKNERVAFIEEILIYSEDKERVNTKWVVTDKSHFIIII